MQEYAIEKARIRRSFDRAAASYDQHARLQGMVREEMLSRLAWIRLDPALVVDLGCGTGRALRGLRKRFPRARLIGMDISQGMLVQARRHQPWLRRPHLVRADMERLPVADASVDLLFSNLAMQWSQDPAVVFREVRRVLKPDGLFLFSTLGPDTLHELRASWQAADPGHAHVNPFIDMHDLGDALLRSGLRDAVMDVDRLRLHHPDVLSLMQGLKAIGAGNGLAGRARGLTGKGRLGRVLEVYEGYRDPDGRVPVTYEVIHGHAWGARAGLYGADAQGEVRIPLCSIR